MVQISTLVSRPVTISVRERRNSVLKLYERRIRLLFTITWLNLCRFLISIRIINSQIPQKQKIMTKKRLYELQDQQYYPYIKQLKFQAIKKKKQSVKARFMETNRHTWTSLENSRYTLFIKTQKQKLEMTNQASKRMIFTKMALAVKSRNPQQCKSHHQKMLKRDKSIDEIVKRFEDILRVQENKSQQASSDTQNGQSMCDFPAQQGVYPDLTIISLNSSETLQLDIKTKDNSQEQLWDVLDFQN